MLIKLNVEGELLDNLLRDAKENCRTNPQQIIYYLKQIYKGNIVVLDSTNKVLSSDIRVLSSDDKKLDSTEKELDSANNDKYLDNLGSDIIDF